jgi:hypothetical protein
MQAYMETFKRFEERSQLDELETIFESFKQIAFFEKSQLSEPAANRICVCGRTATDSPFPSLPLPG